MRGTNRIILEIVSCLVPLFNGEMEYRIIITQYDVDEYNQKYFKEHPRATKVRIKAPQHPSLNEYMVANNQARNNQKQTWKDFIVWILQKRNLTGIGVDRCEITYRTFFKTRRIHDLDNVTPKYILDGMTDAGFLVADDYNHVVRLITECGYDGENPRIELIVNEL